MIFKTTKLPALLKPKVVEAATTGVLARAAEGLSAARPGSRDLFGPQGELATGVFTKAGAADSEAISEAIAESLLTKVVARAELRGSGVEVYGRGDAELIRRRKWVDQLDKQKVVSLDEAAPGAAWLAEDRRVNAMLERAEQPNVGMPDAQWSALRTETAQMLQAQLGKTSGALLHPFGPAVKTAVEALKTTSTPAGDLLKALTTAQEQVAAHPAGSAMVEPLAKATDAFLWRELGDAVAKSKLANDKAAVESATALKTGAKRFVEADPQALSTAVMKQLTDPEQRARSLADLLLQFRAPEDISGPKKRLFAGGEGIQAVAELRQNTKSVTSAFGDPKTEREYALMRAVTLANPRLSSNAVLEARHVVSKLRRMSWELVYGPNSAPKGHETAPYAAIHHNFSANTPAVIDSYVRNTLFAGGDPEHFVSFVDAMNRAKDMKTPAEMAAVLSPLKNLPEFEAFSAHRAQNPSLGLAAQLEGFLASKVKGVLDSKSADDPNLSPAERENLRGGGVESVKGEYAEKLSLSAQLFRAVCKSMPNAESLAESLFDAGGARPEVAKAIAALSEPDAGVGLLDTLVSARRALRTEFDKTTDGSARLGLWKLDGQLERLIGGELGKRVSAPEGVSSVEQNRADAMAMRAAVESSRLSGLDQMRVIGGSNAQAGTSFAAASAALSQVIDSPTMRSDAFRQAMGVAQASVVDSVDNIKRFMDPRIADVSNGKLIPNPAFFDDFVKEGPLHYATALGQRARGVGLKQEISATRIRNPEGVSPLNPVGPVVFDRLVYVPTMDALRELNPGPNDLAIVPEMDEKKMVRAGGVWSVFPNGQAHAVVYGRGAGMAIVTGGDFDALMKFAGNMRKADGKPSKVYYDDSNGLTLMPYDEALASGLAKVGDDERLKSGTNRRVEYKQWNEGAQQWDTAGRHEVTVHPNRTTHDIIIYSPSEKIRGLGDKAMSFAELASLGVDGRGVGGEKNMVLALMSQHPLLAKYIPPGGLLPTGRCYQVLRDAGIKAAWDEPILHDPIVGKITDANFMKSKFYTDAAYRKSTRERLFELTKTEIRKSLLNPDGTPSKTGRALIDELKGPSEIIRSSYSAEDRPYKSGAGQYDSFPNSFTDRKVLEAVADGLASAWDEAPIENNVKDEYNIVHIQPSLTVMKQVDVGFSGVLQSRDSETGYRRTVSYQAVKGFGGGVEDVTASEQGKITKDGRQIARLTEGENASLLSEAEAAELREVGLTIERLFHDVIEPGKAHAVDVEWAYDKKEKQIKIVQARTLPT